MASERAKVSQLQSNHLALSRELSHAREAELAQRRERGVVEGEIENVWKKYEGVVSELEGEVRR
jgi:kinesin family protein C1